MTDVIKEVNKRANERLYFSEATPMTAKPEELIQKLRVRAFLPDSSEAADLIEELLTEVKQLRRANMSWSETIEELTDLYENLQAKNRRLQEELEKAKADLGARNRILTEEP